MSLFNRAVSGVKWSSAAQCYRQGLQFLTLIIIARILSPEDFGLVAMATVVTGFLQIFSDLGASAALIQKKDVSTDLASSLFWVSVVFGVILFAVVFFSAPLVGFFYDDLRVVELLRVLSISFLISGFYAIHQAILQKELEFKCLALIEISATTVGAIVALGSALVGAGVWSLVFQTVSLSFTTLVMVWLLSDWRPGIVVNIKELKFVSSYSLNLVGHNIFNYFARNMDYLLIGKFLGAQDLGFYTLAYRIMLYPLQNISNVIGRVMFPVYSQMQDDDVRFSRAYLKVVAAIAFVTFPMMAGLMMLSQLFVKVAFGESWYPVAILLMILAPVGMGQSIGTTVGAIYQAKGRTDWLMRWGLVAGCLTVCSFVLGLRWGIVGVASSYAMVSLLVLAYPSFSIPLRLIGLKVSQLLSAVWPAMKCSIVMVAALQFFNLGLQGSLDETTTLIFAILVGGLVYLAATIVMNRNQLDEFVAFVRGRA